MLNIPKISVGDTLELKKTHHCGVRTFTVLRVGSDIRIVCTGCGRDMTMERIKLEHALRRVLPAAPATPDNPNQGKAR